MRSSIATVAIVFVAASLAASAEEPRLLGPRTLGMGGAGVASARGVWSLMSNPAGLAEDKVGAASRAAVSLAGGIRDIGLVNAIDKLSDHDWDKLRGDPASNVAEIATIVTELQDLNKGRGLMIGAGGGAAGAGGGFGAGLLFDFKASFKPFVDLENTNPTTNGGDRSFATNASAVAVKAIALTELPIAYAQKFDLGAGAVSVGGALRIIRAITYDERVDPTLANSDDFQDSIADSETVSMNVGIDLGAIYHPPVEGLSVGLVARNINSPKFDTYTGDVKEDVQVRVGAEWAFWDRLLCVAFDADLNNRSTILDGYEERWIGGGIALEGTPSVFGLGARFGFMRNVAESSPGTILTAGISAGLKWFHLSTSVAWSTEKSKYDETTIPAELTGMIALEATW